MANRSGRPGTNKTHKIDPRATAFKRYYLDSNNSKTFCNITQSALTAGFSESYARNLSGHINQAKWYQEFTEESDFLRANMLKKAEKTLNETLTTEAPTLPERKLKTDVAKFVSERVGKDHYSTRKELTDKGGKRLFTNKVQSTHDVELEDLFIAPN